jgi:hypothetical protein
MRESDIENTEKTRGLHDLPILGGQAASDRTEADERRGTQQLAASGQFLPVDGPRAELEALGFVFGAPKHGDPLFVHVAFPDGWSMQISDHSMWNYVVDGTGKRRVAVFYKAAFYDRNAKCYIERDPT